ncbi:MAG: hypothetical protein ACI8ZB_003407 [Desulforhopalus sp.]
MQDIGFISQQITHLPTLSFSLQEALGLTYAIATALGEGPLGSTGGGVRALSAVVQNRFNMNYFDVNVQLFDVIEFFNDGIRYVNEAGPQLSELDNTDDIETSLLGNSTTLALVTKSVI